MSFWVRQWPAHQPYLLEGTTMSRYWKSIIAVLTAVAITTVQAVISAQADGDWTTEDTLVTLLAFLGAVAVYAKTNVTPAGKPYDPAISEAETGHADFSTVLIALACSVLVLALYLLLR